MSSPTLYLMCGLPGAGKTTRAHRLCTQTGALYLSADAWVESLGRSLVDYEFRFKLQDCLLVHAGKLLTHHMSVILEFGSWSRSERDTIRQVAVTSRARTELHFVDAPIDELARRIRARGGPDAESLVTDVLLPLHHRFERPTRE